MRFECPHCHSQHEAPEPNPGQGVQCPNCFRVSVPISLAQQIVQSKAVVLPPLPSHDSPALPVSRPQVLPRGIKAIGWIGVIVGGWIFIVGGALLASGFPDRTRLVELDKILHIFSLGAWTIGGLWAISSAGLLQRRTWGRKASILVLGLIFAGSALYLVSASWAMSSWFPGFIKLFLCVPVLLGTAAVGTPVWLGIRYLRKPSIRKLF